MVYSCSAWLLDGRSTGILAASVRCSVTYTRKSLTANKWLSIFVHVVPGTYTIKVKLAYALVLIRGHTVPLGWRVRE